MNVKAAAVLLDGGGVSLHFYASDFHTLQKGV